MKRFGLVFLILAAVLGLWFWQTRPGERNVVPENADYFDLLREAQLQLRQSPDHLSAQYELIIQSGDVEALVGFVQKSFDVIPPPSGWNASRSSILLGAHGALRTGKGTPRELVDLIANGAVKMGHSVELVSIPTPDELRSFKAPVPPEPDWPEIDGRLLATIVPRPLPEPVTLQRDPEFWAGIEQLLPPNSDASSSATSDEPSRLPSVLITMKDPETGTEIQMLANLWGADHDNPWSSAAWTRLGSPLRSTSSVQLSLLLKTVDNEWHTMPSIAEATFNASDIVGSRIAFGFTPVLSDSQSRFATRPSDVRTFLPFLKVDGGNPELSEDQRRILGTAFTLSGDTASEDNGNALRFGKYSLLTGGDLASVESMIIRDVDAQAWPWLSVSFDPLDSQGNVVNGLPPESVIVTVDDDPVALSLTANQRPPVRIVFLIDGSTSVAPQYRAENLETVVHDMAEAIKAAYPGAEFLIMGDSGLRSFDDWSDDLTALAAKAATMGRTSNRMWTSVIRASDREPDAIVYFTDGNDVEFSDQDGALDLEDLPRDLQIQLAQAPVTYTLGGAQPPDFLLGPAFDGLPEATGGEAFAITDHAAAIEAVTGALADHIGAYRGFVRLPESISDRRDVAVLRITANGVDDTMSFAKPEPDSLQESSEIEGLYLRVRWNAAETSVHRLAGAPYGQTASRVDRRNAHLGLFGHYTLVSQAGPVNAAVMLDEMIEARLGLEAVLEAQSEDAAETAFADIPVLPETAYSYAVDLESVHDLNPRLWIDADQRWVLGGQEVAIHRTDIIPLRLFAKDRDDIDSRTAVLRASALINDIEASLFPQTNRDCLAPPLTLTQDFRLRGDRRQQIEKLSAGYGSAMTYAVPSEGEIDCVIGITSGTGAALFINSFGGAGITVEEVNQTFEEVSNLLDIASELGGAIAAWASLEQAKMDHLHMATVSILTMEPPDLEGYYRDQACGALEDQAGSAIGGVIGTIGGDGASDAWEAYGELSGMAEDLGFGGFDPSIPIPGCEE